MTQKQDTVIKYAQKFHCNTFIETGTYMGDMVDAVKHEFKKIISIELSHSLACGAMRKFKPFKHITILRGDSSNILKYALMYVNSPYLCWLDAHYSGGKTVRGVKDTPIMEELECIFGNSVQDEGYVILIDDARCFNGESDYPTLKELEKFVLLKRPKCTFDVEGDIIRITR